MNADFQVQIDNVFTPIAAGNTRKFRVTNPAGNPTVEYKTSEGAGPTTVAANANSGLVTSYIDALWLRSQGARCAVRVELVES